MARKIAYVIIFALGLVLGGCGAHAPDDSAVARAVEATLTAWVPTSPVEPIELSTRLPQATSTPLATLELAPTATVVPAQAGAPDLVEAQVLEVVDGDTIKASIDGQVYSLRYIGMDSPETKDPNQPVQPFGEEATQKNQELVGGKTVRLEKDVSETDRYGRLLRYVWVGDLMINAEMVRQGYAQVATYPPDVKYQELFLRLQQEARDAGRGLWAAVSASSATPAPIRAVVVPAATGRASPGPSSPTSYTCDRCIKGNISSNGEKIYHLPGCTDYDKTVISENKGERWFSSETEAQAAGWRKAKNCP